MAEYSVLDSVLYYGLFLGGVFQLICILAIIFIPQKTLDEYENTDGNASTKGHSSAIQTTTTTTVVHRSKTDKRRKK